MSAYYNEFNKQAANWLRELIKVGLIAPGEVDTRSIEDVCTDDLLGFKQCHFFAGVGVWSYALRRAGWDDDREIWTGSCPCQPFSAAGEGAGFADERHLWPAFYHLIGERRPECVLGEQVASKVADPWVDLVHTDLEAVGYAFGAVAFPSAGVGAPHIRDRTYWAAQRLADADQRKRGSGRARPGEASWAHGQLTGRSPIDGLADAGEGERRRRPDDGALLGNGAAAGRHQIAGDAERPGDACGLAHADGGNAGPERQQCGGQQRLQPQHDGAVRQGRGGREDRAGAELERPGPTNGRWSDADWLFCRDGRWRPVEPESFPLAYGLPVSMGKLRPEQRRLAELAGLDAASLARAKQYRIASLHGYGNAINAEAATEFVAAFMHAIGG